MEWAEGARAASTQSWKWRHSLKVRYLVAYFLLKGSPELKGGNLRHPPRAISARATSAYLPRSVAIPRTPALRVGCSGDTHVLGRGRNPLPSAGLLLAVVGQSVRSYSIKGYVQYITSSFNRPSESALAQPLSSLLYEFFSSLPLLYVCESVGDGARPLALDAS